MKLYPVAPNADMVAKHFERMARGQLPTARDQHIGYGFLGSRVKFGSYTHMKGGAESKQPKTVHGITPTEVGIQQAKSELQAQTRIIKKKGTKKRIKATPAKGKGQNKSSQQGGKKSTAAATAAAKKKDKKKKKKKEEAEQKKKQKDKKKVTLKRRRKKGKVI